MVGFLLHLGGKAGEAIVFPISYVYSRAKGKRSADDQHRYYAYSIDIYANYQCADLFNDTLIKKGATIPFGIKGLTISAVLGFAEFEGKLTKAGLRVSKILTKIDKTKIGNKRGEHCLRSIWMTDEEIAAFRAGNTNLTIEDLVLRNYKNDV